MNTKGNEIYQNEKIVTGSLIVTAKGISDILYEVSSDFVSYKIIMTPQEAFTVIQSPLTSHVSSRFEYYHKNDTKNK